MNIFYFVSIGICFFDYDVGFCCVGFYDFFKEYFVRGWMYDSG